MSDQLLREVVILILGKGNEPIADLLNSNKYVNEFNIAKSLGITINQTRNLLYKISDYGLVISERKKDKKKGWYTYYWRFDILKCLVFLRDALLKKRGQFENQIIRRKENQFYVCEDCNIEFSEEDVLQLDFTCDECGELLKLKDDSNLIKGMQRNVDKLNSKLETVNEEINKEIEKLEKKKQLKLKKEEKEAEKKKEEAKKKREEKKKETKEKKKKNSSPKTLVKKVPSKKKTGDKKTTKTKQKASEKKETKKVEKKSKSTKKKVVKEKKAVKKKGASKKK